MLPGPDLDIHELLGQLLKLPADSKYNLSLSVHDRRGHPLELHIDLQIVAKDVDPNDITRVFRSVPGGFVGVKEAAPRIDKPPELLSG